MANRGKSTGMVFDDIKQAAYQRDAEAISGAFEWAAYEAMANLYDRYRNHYITKDQAEKETREIEKNFNAGIKLRDMYDATCKMRVALAGISKNVDPNRCPVLRTLDERGCIDDVYCDGCQKKKGR